MLLSHNVHSSNDYIYDICREKKEKAKKGRKQGFLTGIFKNSPHDQEVPQEDLDADEEG